MFSIHGPHLSRRVGTSCNISNHLNSSTSCSFNCCWTACAWYSNENHAAMVIYCHIYSHQNVEYFEVDLIGSKPANQKHFLTGLGIEPGTFQSWVYCLANWAITPLLGQFSFILLAFCNINYWQTLLYNIWLKNFPIGPFWTYWQTPYFSKWPTIWGPKYLWKIFATTLLVINIAGGPLICHTNFTSTYLKL